MSDTSTASPTAATALDAVTCVFCGLHCDDLTVRAVARKLTPVRLSCAKAVAGYAGLSSNDTPRIKGRAVTRDEALSAAAKLLREARRPLLGGLATDVNGMRAAVRFAERFNGALEHLHAGATRRSLQVLQQRGWHTTTLGEVHNRADLVILVGAEVERAFPRFISRHLAGRHALQAERRKARRLVYLGPAAQAPAETSGLPTQRITVPASALAETVRLLQGLVMGAHAPAPRGQRGAALQALATEIRAAEYPVFVWAAGQLDPTTGDLLIAAVCDLVSQINRTRRAAGLALGGDDGAQTAMAAMGWLTGFGNGVGFSAGELNPRIADGADAGTLLLRGDADLLLFINSYSRREPPQGSWPSIVLAPPGITSAADADVYLPTGIPGVDHAGQIIRTDGVVALPLRALREAAHPSVAETLEALSAACETKS